MTPDQQASITETVHKILLFTDIVGSVDLKTRLGNVASAELIERHDKIYREAVESVPLPEVNIDRQTTACG